MAGTQRSGSNLLRLLIGAHGAAATPPSTHMYSVFRDVSHMYGPLDVRTNRLRIVNDIRQLIELNVLAWPAGPPEAERINRLWAGRSIERLCSAVYDAEAERSHHSAWLCKSLENVRYLPNLIRRIPDLSVLHVLRDGRDVALSFRDAPIGPKHPVVAADEWARDQRAALNVRPDRRRPVFQVRYEVLTTDTQSALEPVLSYLGVGFDRSALAFHESENAQSAPRLSRLWNNLDRPVISGNSRYRDPPNEEFVRMFEGAAFSMLVETGYEPVYVSGPSQHSAEEMEQFVAADRKLRSITRSMADPAIEALHAPQAEFIHALRRRAGLIA